MARVKDNVTQQQVEYQRDQLVQVLSSFVHCGEIYYVALDISGNFIVFYHRLLHDFQPYDQLFGAGPLGPPGPPPTWNCPCGATKLQENEKSCWRCGGKKP